MSRWQPPFPDRTCDTCAWCVPEGWPIHYPGSPHPDACAALPKLSELPYLGTCALWERNPREAAIAKLEKEQDSVEQ